MVLDSEFRRAATPQCQCGHDTLSGNSLVCTARLLPSESMLTLTMNLTQDGQRSQRGQSNSGLALAMIAAFINVRGGVLDTAWWQSPSPPAVAAAFTAAAMAPLPGTWQVATTRCYSCPMDETIGMQDVRSWSQTEPD